MRSSPVSGLGDVNKRQVMSFLKATWLNEVRPERRTPLGAGPQSSVRRVRNLGMGRPEVKNHTVVVGQLFDEETASSG